MTLQTVSTGKGTRAFRALEWFFSSVSPFMRCEMRMPLKAFLAEFAVVPGRAVSFAPSPSAHTMCTMMSTSVMILFRNIHVFFLRWAVGLRAEAAIFLGFIHFVVFLALCLCLLYSGLLTLGLHFPESLGRAPPWFHFRQPGLYSSISHNNSVCFHTTTVVFGGPRWSNNAAGLV